jgi:hypothetical protein
MTTWPGLPRPPHIQAPRRMMSLRFPPDPRKVRIATVADVAREVQQCPYWARSMFCIPWGGALICYEDAVAIVRAAAPKVESADAHAHALRVGRAVLRLKREADAKGKRVLP